MCGRGCTIADYEIVNGEETTELLPRWCVPAKLLNRLGTVERVAK